MTVDIYAETDADFVRWLQSPDGDCIAVRLLGDGRYLAIRRLMFHWTLLIGAVGDRISYDDRYCYQTLAGATAALEAWDGSGDPDGWHRHPKSGRRRPGGLAQLEFTDP